MESFFILKMFCHKVVKAYEERRKLEQRGNRDELKKWRESESYKDWLIGPCDHAYFKSKDDALNYIAANPDWIAEGAYYTVLVLLEKGFGGQGAAISWPDEHETWFQFQRPRPPVENKYKKIKRPDWALGTAF